MMEQKLTIKVASTRKYLNLWNGIFNLTPKELRVLSTMVDVARKKKEQNICNVKVKKEAARLLEEPDFNTLNNYVKKLKDKGAIKKVGKNYELHKLLKRGTSKVTVNLNWEDNE
tara:strand:+ start:2742 stop:3083 length:342 start_codon:yes stop_codon:yes gene_type:complete